MLNIKNVSLKCDIKFHLGFLCGNFLFDEFGKKKFHIAGDKGKLKSLTDGNFAEKGKAFFFSFIF